MAKKKRVVRNLVEEFEMKDGRKIYLLADGRLVNLSAAEGHPASVMDMSFANQALAAEYIAKNHKRLAPGVYPVPTNIDASVARLKLRSLQVSIDRLSSAQRTYLSSWQEGT